MKIIISITTIHGDKIELLTETNETVNSDINLSQHARWFDGKCIAWTKDSRFNRMFLKEQQNYCNDLLKVKGYLFLNDVYDQLGIPKSKAGQLVGWVYENGKTVDFGLGLDVNRDFIMGETNKALLDFNVDGIILDKI